MSVWPESRQNVDPEPERPVPPDAPLVEYRQRQLQLGDLIRGASQLASERRSRRGEESPRELAARELLGRLADDRFQLAVVGQFSRGKSTLMNAIMGAPYLPTGALPMTSVVTTVSYGSRPRVTVRRRGAGRLPIETNLEELVRFVAQSSDERDQLQVASADIQLPAEILRLGFHFVDTPGIGSAVAANTATTKTFLPSADAVIFVTSFDAPLSEAELAFFADVRHRVERVFVVVNKLDLVKPREAQEVEEFIHRRLAELVDSAEIRLFAISATAALEAKRSGNTKQLEGSGLPELERSLVRFLSEEKASTFLLAVAGRAQRLLGQVRFDLLLGRTGAARQAGVTTDPLAGFETRVEELLAEQRRVVNRLLERIATELPDVLAKRSADWAEQLRGVALTELGALSPDGDRGTAESLRVATSELEHAVASRLPPWIASRVAQTRSLLLELAAGDLAALDSLERSVERLAADSFDVPLAEDEPPGWSPSDLPELAIPKVAFSIPVRLPSRLPKLPGSRHQAEDRLAEAIDAGISAFADDLQSTLARAAQGWAEAVAAAVERNTRRSADHVQGNARKSTTDEQLTELEQLDRRLMAFQVEVAARSWTGHDAAASASASASVSASTEPVPPTARGGRCVICEQVAAIPFEYMARAQWDLFRHEDRREEHARDGGFCSLHTWQYAEIASEVGIALAYAPLARAAAEAISSAGGGGPQALSAALAGLLPTPDRCAACRALAEAERDAIAELGAALAEEPEHSEPAPLCVPHLAAVIATEPGLSMAGRLAARLAATLRRSAEDMQAFSLKRESLRAYLLSDEEQAACMRAIRLLGGRRELARPFRLNDEIG